MRDGNPRGRRHGAQRGHTRDDLELDPGLRQCERLLAAAAEDERVAALQPHDAEPRTPVGDQQLVDLGLGVRLVGDADRVGGSLVDELRRDETVVDQHLARPHQVEAARRDQARIPGAGSDQEHAHRSASSTSAWK